MTTATNYADWLKDLLQDAQSLPVESRDGDKITWYEEQQAVRWLVSAGSAVNAITPIGHELRQWWKKQVPPGKAVLLHSAVTMTKAIAIIEAALDLLENGRFGSLMDSVRAETVSEVLDQADVLANQGHSAAATVLAGGALETHLLHLCNTNSLSWSGHGSISKYDGAIAQERNNGNEIYSRADTNQVGAWGGHRNAAAHDPTNFNRSKDETTLMIEGIRQFVARTS